MTSATVESRVLELETLDEKFNIGHAIAINYGRSTVVIVEGRDGMVGIGRCVPWPEHPFDVETAIRRAHFKARGKLARARRFRAKESAQLAERQRRGRERFEAEAAE
jgi:ribosomal protein S5